MKVLVFSDSHGNLTNAKEVLARIGDSMDAVVHLGDYDQDGEDLAKLFPKLPFHIIQGNNDVFSSSPVQKRVIFAGVSFLLTHGHKERVYFGVQTLQYLGQEQGVSAVLFGHTHVPFSDDQGEVFLFNPGSISSPRDGGRPTFGVLEITENKRIQSSVMEFSREGQFLRRNKVMHG